MILLSRLIGEVGITDAMEENMEPAGADTPELNEADDAELRASEEALVVEGDVIDRFRSRVALIP